MMSPSRLLSSWLDLNRLETRRLDVERQLSLALRQPLLLEPAKLSAGLDRMFTVRTRCWQSEVIACVRMNSCLPTSRAPEPHLPRRALRPADRLAREACAYRRLSAVELSPQLLARGPVFLANHWLPWPRLSHVLKRSPELLWTILPVVLDAVSRMHEEGVAHLDLNCGNVLVAPDCSRVALIDFEFAPLGGLTFADQRRFDFLRLAHNLLKPRRGRVAALREPRHFAAAIASAATSDNDSASELLDPRGFARIFDHPHIGGTLAKAFGVETHSRIVP